VTVFRTSRGGSAWSSSAPHRPQKRKPSGLSWPQLAQVGTS
jgi:hypothetical protein